MTPKKGRGIGAYLLVFVVLIGALVFLLTGMKGGGKETKYSDIMKYFDNYEVTGYTLDLGSGELKLTLENGDKLTYDVPNVSVFRQDTETYRKDYNEKHPDQPLQVDYYKIRDTSWLLTLIPTLVLLVLMILLFVFMMRQANGGGKYTSFGKANIKNQANTRKATFADVAGADEEKHELEEIVDFLKNPRKYAELGARIPKGVLLMGPPGIGKTQVMEQVARECGVALVAYTITHHTRQSAVGLPFIRQRHYGDKDVSVTEYTMSEIIASIYAKMEATGLSEGILFIDEINCVSETLAPTMLQFLQCKTFGNQAVPAGWVIVAAGNPPEYNKSVRDFDIVTLDRVRRMDIEPDLPVWKDYARAAHIHSAILSYLELHPQNFYQINADVDGTQFVTARGWEDLSNLLDTYEALGLQADEELIREYIQHPKIAEDFSAYLDLYYKYRDDYGVEEILAGQAKPAVFARLLQAPFDERLSLVSLLLAGLDTRFTASLQADAVADACYAFLRETKKALATLPEDIPDGSAELFSQQIKDYETDTQQKRDAGLLGRAELTNRLQVQAALHQWEGELRRANAAGTQEAFDLLRGQFRALADQREATQKTAAAALEAAFDFMEQAFAESQEMVVFVTELTVNPASHQFLTENGCERYFKYNKDLLLDHRKAALQQELAAEQRRHGSV